MENIADQIIKANSQAEAKEAERLRQEAEQYEKQLDEIKENAKEYKRQLGEIKENSEEYKKHLEGINQNTHDIGVQIYRNVEAVINKSSEKTKEELKEITVKLNALQTAVEGQNGSIFPLLIGTLLVGLADLVINILHILGVL